MILSLRHGLSLSLSLPQCAKSSIFKSDRLGPDSLAVLEIFLVTIKWLIWANICSIYKTMWEVPKMKWLTWVLTPFVSSFYVLLLSDLIHFNSVTKQEWHHDPPIPLAMNLNVIQDHTPIFNKYCWFFSLNLSNTALIWKPKFRCSSSLSSTMTTASF